MRLYFLLCCMLLGESSPNSARGWGLAQCERGHGKLHYAAVLRTIGEGWHSWPHVCTCFAIGICVRCCRDCEEALQCMRHLFRPQPEIACIIAATMQRQAYEEQQLDEDGMDGREAR